MNGDLTATLPNVPLPIFPIRLSKEEQAEWEAAAGGEPIEKARAGGTKTPAVGMRNGRAKITPTKRLEIEARLAAGEAVRAIAKDLDLSPKAIRNVRSSTASVVAATTLEKVESPSE